MIIDATYFQEGELIIPNAVDGNSSENAVTTVLDSLIKKYERQLLLDALGLSMYNELQLALAKLPFTTGASETAEQKWIDLVNGTDYTKEDNSYRWDGLKKLIPDYVFCMYLRNDEINYSTTGMAKNTVLNAKNAGFITTYVRIWSQFIEKYQGEGCVIRSLFQYLDDNEVDFPKPNKREYAQVNRFGI